MSDRPPQGGPGRGERCLVTGASGFIGGRLAERLTRAGYVVRGLVRASSDTTRLRGLDIEIVVGDLNDAYSLAAAVEGCDHVLHCAALVSDWATTKEMVQTNVTGTRRALEASARASVARFIHLSTTDVYGYPGGRGVDESFDGKRPFANWYAHTKRLAEREIRDTPAGRRLETVILRPATVYGPGSTDVIGQIARAIRGHNMLLIDRGRTVAGLCYVDNLIDAALIALHHDAAPGNSFNVSDGLTVTWRQLSNDLAAGLGCRQVRWSLPYPVANAIGFSLEHGYRLLRAGTGISTPPLLSRQAVQVLGREQDFSNGKLRRTLAWEPRVGYPEGLQATLEWLTSEYLASGRPAVRRP